MRNRMLFIILTFGVVYSCQKDVEQTTRQNITFEKINYYKFPAEGNTAPFQYRLTYYFDNGLPHRWLETDSLGRVMTDYLYEYDDDWKQTGARYREEGAPTFSIERVNFPDDSTMVTEWLDSVGQVYYRMIDNLNKDKKTYRAAFVGDETHGYDSTFYTSEGFVQRIFFTNTKGKVYNDRRFVYDSVNAKGDWTLRNKVMNDTIREVQEREVYYNKDYASANDSYYEGILSTGELSENVMSFSEDETMAFLTRTDDWTNQYPYLALKKDGIFTETIRLDTLGTIYNGAIAPKGDKIIYSVREGDEVTIWLAKKENGSWSTKINLTASSNIRGGYFYWYNDHELYFYNASDSGDIMRAELKEDTLMITDSLPSINTDTGTEFSPYVAKDKRFMLFTRYEEGTPDQQGFFVSYNEGSAAQPLWATPEKLRMLPYGWNAYIVNNGNQFIYSNGEDFKSMPLSSLQLKLDD